MDAFSVVVCCSLMMLANGFINQLLPSLLLHPLSCTSLSASQIATTILCLSFFFFFFLSLAHLWVTAALEMGDISSRAYYVVVPTTMTVVTMMLRILSVP